MLTLKYNTSYISWKPSITDHCSGMLKCQNDFERLSLLAYNLHTVGKLASINQLNASHYCNSIGWLDISLVTLSHSVVSFYSLIWSLDVFLQHFVSSLLWNAAIFSPLLKYLMMQLSPSFSISLSLTLSLSFHLSLLLILPNRPTCGSGGVISTVGWFLRWCAQ